MQPVTPTIPRGNKLIYRGQKAKLDETLHALAESIAENYITENSFDDKTVIIDKEELAILLENGIEKLNEIRFQNVFINTRLARLQHKPNPIAGSFPYNNQ
jgi:hypothetical protein